MANVDEVGYRQQLSKPNFKCSTTIHDSDTGEAALCDIFFKKKEAEQTRHCRHTHIHNMEGDVPPSQYYAYV